MEGIPNVKNVLARSRAALIVAAIALLALAAACSDGETEQPAATPLKLGLLLNFTGSPEASADRQRAFDLAIRHVNEAGGVLGVPVEGVVADATGDPAVAADVARRLVEVDGVHAIVGPNASSAALPIAKSVSGALGVPTISPSATSPQLTAVQDDGYFFRTALSDAAQGPVLARVTSERGFTNVGLVFQDDAWGRGLADAFQAAWNGALQSVAIDGEQTSYLSALEQSASAGAEALVVIAFEAQALGIVREALDGGLYDQFVFGDAAKRVSLVKELGGEGLGGMYGTAGASAPDNAATADWEAAFIAVYGELPVLAYVKETYDATVALALAAPSCGQRRRRRHPRPPAVRRGPARPGPFLSTPTGVAQGLSLPRRRAGHRPRWRREHAGLERQRRPPPRSHRDVALHLGRTHRGA